MSRSAKAALSEDQLRWFCEFLKSRTGMLFGENKRYYVERRLHDRLRATGLASFEAYFARLRADPAEAAAVTDAFTINETYFYREDYQFRCLTRDLLPQLAARRNPGDKIRIWCMPCSTGEEPYSVAIWLLENWPMVDAYNVEIVASDIDATALNAARAGRYGQRALTKLPPPLVDAYFEPAGDGEWAIIQDLRESVIFTPANLVERTSMLANGTFDVIFCRNVLIYFDDPSRVQAADNLYACTAPAGFLCLGHTESMARIDERFEPKRFSDAIVYQRGERG
jgi:chemotaxis protein methyltransferase CheR